MFHKYSLKDVYGTVFVIFINLSFLALPLKNTESTLTELLKYVLIKML